MYNKKYYEENKEKLHAASRKWAAKKREEKIAAGLLKPRANTPEEKFQRATEAKRRGHEKILKKYRENIDGYADLVKARSREANRKRYHSDPEYRKKKAAQLVAWRKNRRA